MATAWLTHGLVEGSIPPELPYPELLTQTAHLLLQDVDPDTLCNAVFRKLQEPFQVDMYVHYLLSADQTQLELASFGGRVDIRKEIGSTLALGAAVCGNVAQQLAPCYIQEVQKRSDPMTAAIRRLGVRAYVCYPLTMRNQVLGTLSFGSTLRSSFSDKERELFGVVAQQVTLATDRRAKNEQLRQLERLATAGRMSATLAHEINNPLESLGNLAYLLQEAVHEPEAEKLAGAIRAQIAQLSSTVQGTLSMFRGGQQEPGTVDLTLLVRTLVASLHLPGNVRLQSEVEDGLCVHAIPGELRQILFNLLVNAAHFTPPGAPVSLSARRVGLEAEIRVRDEGPGISEGTRARMFQPFFTTRGAEGTGIGLWLSRDMLERAGGKLWFESDPAVAPGTVFVATIPLLP